MLPIYPPALMPGSTIAFVAPAGPVDSTRVERARHRLEDLGYRVLVADQVWRRRGYLAGSDQDRAAALMAALQDDQVAAIFPVRGGYGTMRVLDQIDFGLLRDRPKIITGFSDITALHLAIQKQTGLVTFHSPNPMDGLGLAAGLDPVSSQAFWRAIRWEEYVGKDATAAHAGYVCPVGDHVQEIEVLVPGRGSGRLTGGNLSLICALLGTPYEIDTEGSVLLLEETGESPYRIDRYLAQLRLAGKLDALAGVVVGHITGGDVDQTEPSLSVDRVLRDYLQCLPVPVIVGYPVGHAQPNVTLPLGAQVELDADRRQLTVLENPVTVHES